MNYKISILSINIITLSLGKDAIFSKCDWGSYFWSTILAETTENVLSQRIAKKTSQGLLLQTSVYKSLIPGQFMIFSLPDDDDDVWIPHQFNQINPPPTSREGITAGSIILKRFATMEWRIQCLVITLIHSLWLILMEDFILTWLELVLLSKIEITRINNWKKFN